MGCSKGVKNETIEVPDGMIKDVMSGIADAIVSAPRIMHNRYLVIDYLQPIATSSGGVFVKNEALEEGYDFEVFWKQFETWTWITLIFTSVIISFCIIFILKVSGGGMIKLFPIAFVIILKSLKTNLGNDSFEPLRDQVTSLKISYFTALLMGNIVWLAYNGALLSELITPNIVKPFHNWESLI